MHNRVLPTMLFLMMLETSGSNALSNPPPPPPGQVNSYPVYAITYIPSLQDGTMFLVSLSLCYMSLKLIRKIGDNK